jgi:uncharacterized paraquat-inducible protein A
MDYEEIKLYQLWLQDNMWCSILFNYYTYNLLFALDINKTSAVSVIGKGFFFIGLIILLFLFLLLKIELSQDKRINDYYKANSQFRLPLKNGLYECQTCGNNQVKAEHKSCIICSTNFKNRSEYDGNKKQ